MLKSIHRLSTKQFMEVMEKGRIVTSPLFVVRILQNNKKTLGLPPSQSPAELATQKLRSDKLRTPQRDNPSVSIKISAVAPKKVAPSAVLRNRIRRQIYEAVHPLKDSLVPNTSLIIFAKSDVLKVNLETMIVDLKQLFSKAKISV
ncbi:MAG TPA: ribonuclease P protein component [Candidatus Paceibacterota bacterium]|nr:ribonuclease P protein component [Candidatus Paceibacterota bacterium]